MRRTLVLHTLPSNPNEIDADLSLVARGVAEALPGSVLEGVRGEPAELLELLDRHRPEVIFNLCEAPCGRFDWEAHPAALFEWRSLPFTGAPSATLELCHDKARVRAILDAAGIPIARSGRLPAFVKPAGQHGSSGIEAGCLCRTAEEVAAQVARLGSAVVEEYLPGLELVVALWGKDAEHAAVGEVSFGSGPGFLTWSAKWLPESHDYKAAHTVYPASIPAELRQEVLDITRAAWRAVGLRGYARIDLRLDSEGRPRIIDVNPNPDLTPEDPRTSTSGMARAVLSAGWTWARFLRTLVEEAC